MTLTNLNNCKKNSIVLKRLLIAEINAVKSCIDCKQILKPISWDQTSGMKFLKTTRFPCWMNVNPAYIRPQWLWNLNKNENSFSGFSRRSTFHLVSIDYSCTLTLSSHLGCFSWRITPRFRQWEWIAPADSIVYLHAFLYCFSTQFTKVIM